MHCSKSFAGKSNMFKENAAHRPLRSIFFAALACYLAPIRVQRVVSALNQNVPQCFYVVYAYFPELFQ